MFCKGALITGESNIFFDRYSSVPFAPRSLVSANPSEKFYLSFFLQEGPVSENTRKLPGILNIYSKKLSLLWKRKSSCKNNRKGLQKCFAKTTKNSCKNICKHCHLWKNSFVCLRKTSLLVGSEILNILNFDSFSWLILSSSSSGTAISKTILMRLFPNSPCLMYYCC